MSGACGGGWSPMMGREINDYSHPTYCSCSSASREAITLPTISNQVAQLSHKYFRSLFWRFNNPSSSSYNRSMFLIDEYLSKNPNAREKEVFKYVNAEWHKFFPYKCPNH